MVRFLVFCHVALGFPVRLALCKHLVPFGQLRMLQHSANTVRGTCVHILTLDIDVHVQTNLCRSSRMCHLEVVVGQVLGNLQSACVCSSVCHFPGLAFCIVALDCSGVYPIHHPPQLPRRSLVRGQAQNAPERLWRLSDVMAVQLQQAQQWQRIADCGVGMVSNQVVLPIQRMSLEGFP